MPRNNKTTVPDGIIKVYYVKKTPIVQIYLHYNSDSDFFIIAQPETLIDKKMTRKLSCSA